MTPGSAPHPTTPLLQVRHGETPPNRQWRFIGRGDDGLTDRGRRQAARLAATLVSFEPAAIVSSPLRRTLETARAIADEARLAVSRETDLQEQDYGDWEGLTGTEVKARFGDEAARAVFEDPAHAPPRGEALSEVARRAAAAVDRWVDTHAGGTLVLVSHVGPIKSLLCHALGLPLTAMGRFFLDTGTVSVVDWGEAPVVRLINGQPHPDLATARWPGL